jgi:hypothetical protein
MNDAISDRGGRPGWRQAAAAAVAAVALPMAACSGSGSSPSSAAPLGLTTMTAQALAYAKCMRAHGITNFPDPTVQDSARSKGVGFNLGAGIDTHSSQFQSASKQCQKQTGFGHISAAQLQQGMKAMLNYADCMRSHGITNFPDPFENSHQIGFNLTGSGIDPNAPRVKAANKTCQPLMPGGGP